MNLEQLKRGKEIEKEILDLSDQKSSIVTAKSDMDKYPGRVIAVKVLVGNHAYTLTSPVQAIKSFVLLATSEI